MVLAAATVVGMAVMIVAIEAEIGREDSYGDYPATFGLGNTTIVTLNRRLDQQMREVVNRDLGDRDFDQPQADDQD